LSRKRRPKSGQPVTWQYNAENLPVALESDPVDHYAKSFTAHVSEGPFTQTILPVSACHNSSGGGSYLVDGITYDYSYSNMCMRCWTIGEGISPIGLKWNF
jgi:hypothetical protein